MSSAPFSRRRWLTVLTVGIFCMAGAWAPTLARAATGWVDSGTAWYQVVTVADGASTPVLPSIGRGDEYYTMDFSQGQIPVDWSITPQISGLNCGRPSCTAPMHCTTSGGCSYYLLDTGLFDPANGGPTDGTGCPSSCSSVRYSTSEGPPFTSDPQAFTDTGLVSGGSPPTSSSPADPTSAPGIVSSIASSTSSLLPVGLTVLGVVVGICALVLAMRKGWPFLAQLAMRGTR
jgi:hypothetical protein